MKALSAGVGVFITIRLFFIDIWDIRLELVMFCSGVTLNANKMLPIAKVIDTITINGSNSLTFTLYFMKHYFLF
jgi:hypothetical protein